MDWVHDTEGVCGLGARHRGRVWTGCRKQRACVDWLHDTEGVCGLGAGNRGRVWTGCTTQRAGEGSFRYGLKRWACWVLFKISNKSEKYIILVNVHEIIHVRLF